MSLELFNNLLNNVKENNIVQNFMKELSSYLEKASNPLASDENSMTVKRLKEENCLYQVVDIGVDSVFLQNVNNNKVCEEKDIAKELLDKIENDAILRYKDGEYIVDEEITRSIYGFFDRC